MNDIGRVLFSKGITAPQICEALATTHLEVGKRAKTGILTLSTMRDVKQWGALANLLVSRGLDPHVSISASWNQVR